MKEELILLATVLAVLSLSAIGAETRTRSTAQSSNFVTRAFDVLPTMTEKIAAIDEGPNEQALAASTGREDSDLKEFFAGFGMTWPEGSWIRQLPSFGKILVRNTPENMATFEGIICVLGPDFPSEIDVEMQFVEFALSDIEVLARKGLIDCDSLVQLRRAGKGKLLCAPKVVTQSGCEATVKGVTEYIYPTEFSCFCNGDSNSSSAVIGALPVAEPGCFENREVGPVLHVLPEVSSDGAYISLTLDSQVAGDPIWRNYGPQNVTTSGVQPTLNMSMPFFFTQTLRSSVSLFNGATVLAGGGIPGREKDRVIYMFVSAQQKDTEGKPLYKKHGGPEAGEKP
jgi:hypothetical protein